MKFFGLIAILLMGVVNVSYGEECSVDNLPTEVIADLDKYDKALYREPACLGEPPLPAQCNYMGLAEDCSCCFTTCEGANKYLAEYLEDIDEWAAVTSEFINVLINFCPDGEVDSLDKCPITYTDTSMGPTV